MKTTDTDRNIIYCGCIVFFEVCKRPDIVEIELKVPY